MRYPIEPGADLRKADLRVEYMCGADLSGANLRWADLRGADLSGANLRWADLRGAGLSSAGLSKVNGFLLLPIQDHRGYSFVHASLCGDKVWRIIAGCRRFTIDQARAHWGSEKYPDKERAKDYLYAIDWLERKLKSENN